MERIPLLKNLLIAAFLLTAHYAPAQLKEIRTIQQNLPFVKNGKPRIDALNRLAFLMQLKSPDSSYHFALEAREQAARIEYKKGLADAYKTFGTLLTDQNSYLCAKYLHDALDLYREMGLKQEESMTLMNISNLLYVEQDSAHAKEYLMQAYRLGQTLKKDSVLSVILINMLYRDNSFHSTQMDTLYKRGLTIAQKYGDERMMLSYKQLQGHILWNRGHHAEAVQLLENMLPTCDSTGNEFEKMNIYQRLCDWLIHHDPDKALYYYRRALQEADQYKYPLRTIIFAESLYNYYKKQQNSAEALKYANILLEATRKKEQALKQYNYNVIGFAIRDRDLRTAVENERAANRLLIFFIVLSILTLMLLLVVYRSFRISKKYELLQSTLKEKTEERNRTLEQWNKFYDMLLSVLAHDLRQPFASIVMSTDLLNFAKNAFTEEELIAIIRGLNNTASKSIDLLQGILHWVKSKKEGAPSKIRLALHDLINEANSLHLLDQQKKGIRFILDIPKEKTIYAHEQMLLFICRNILNNATKYTRPGGVIRAYSYSSENSTVVAIEDTGKGMDPGQLSKLFSIKESDPLDVAQGAGIALLIANDMITHMHGKFWAESETDKGATFYFELPDEVRQH